MFFLSPRVGRLSMRFGPRLFMGIGPFVCAAVDPLDARALARLRLLDVLLPPLLVFAAGLSLIVAPLTATVLADAGQGDAGIASGVNNAVARVAGLLGIAVVGAAIAGAANQLDMPGYRHGDGDHGRPASSLGGATGSRASAKVPAPRTAAEAPGVSAAAEIVFDRVTKRYAGREGAALSELSLTIPAGTFCVLVGPSGGGKTTALKLVNRLIPFDEGDIRIDGRSIRDLPAVELRRGIGYVIQHVGLFPHMTVGENIATVPQAPRLGEGAGSGSGPPSCSSWSGSSRATRSGTRPSSRAASGSASGSPGRSPPTRPCS